MKDDISKIQERIDALKSVETKRKPSYSSASRGYRIVVELFSGVAVGLAIGYFFDDLFNTKPLFMAMFLIFGAMAGILNVYRISKREDNNG